MSGEYVLAGGKGRATIPLTDFLTTNDYFGPKGGVYYVDGNVSATGSGSPDHPYLTLAEAITASNTSIALSANRWWARRNRIYVCGDALSENLTAFPTKCDVIGCGSYDGFTKAGLSGRHVPASESYGTRWFNMHFKAVAHASAIHTLAGASSVSGTQFIGCTFDGTLGTMTSAILATAVPFLNVIDCDFMGTFVTSYISFGAGEAGGTRILGNRMLGTAAKGIVAPNTTTASWKPLIQGNSLHATGLTIDDDSDLFYVVDNRLMTDANIATTTDGYDFNLALASGNILTGATGVAATVPFAVVAE